MQTRLLQYLDLDSRSRPRSAKMLLLMPNKSVHCASKRDNDHPRQQKYKARGEDSDAVRKLKVGGEMNGI